MAYHFQNVNRYIYVLQLEEGNYYIGQTDDLVERIHEHRTGKGATWTKIYKVINTVETLCVGVCNLEKAKITEDRITLEYMKRFGWQKVRGGDYSNSNDDVVFEKLKELKEKGIIDFDIDDPVYFEKHYVKHYSGMHKNKEKSSLFNDLDKITRVSVLNSINNIFQPHIRKMSCEEIQQINVSFLVDKWYESTKDRFSEINLDDVIKQFESLKENRLKIIKSMLEN